LEEIMRNAFNVPALLLFKFFLYSLSLSLLLLPVGAKALTVTNNGDSGFGSLRWAVVNTPPGGTVDFDFGSPMTITLTSGEIVIDKDLTIDGGNTVTVSGNDIVRIFAIDDGTGSFVDVTLNGLVLTGGSVSGRGGAIFNSENLTINSSSITENEVRTANGHGGGIYSESGTTLIRDSTISRNRAFGSGGGIYCGAVCDITNSTISTNSSGSSVDGYYGSGVYYSGGSSTVANSTVVDNTGGSGLYYDIDTPTSFVLFSTIVANNQPADVNEANSAATINADFSLVENPEENSLVDGVDNNIIGRDPEYLFLGNNGGHTETHALKDTSPAISAGSNELLGLSYDQRGAAPFARDDNVDIGAIEFSSNTFLSVTKNGTATGTVTADPGIIDCGSVCSQYNDPNSTVTLIATPDFGSAFSGWSHDCSGTAPCVVDMYIDRSVEAVFDVATYTLTVTLAGNGEGEVISDIGAISCGDTCVDTYTHDDVVTLTAIPQGRSEFLGWGGACSGTTSECQITVQQISEVTATFQNPFPWAMFIPSFQER